MITAPVTPGSIRGELCEDRSVIDEARARPGGVPRTGSGLMGALLRQPDRIVRRDRTLTRVAIWTGAIFIVAGLVKFVFHHWELHAFRDFGLPCPAALEIFAGVLETLGGILLMARRLIVPVAFLLAVTMIVATVSSGILHGDIIPSLTLAPALLLAMVYLLARTLGPRRVRPRG